MIVLQAVGAFKHGARQDGILQSCCASQLLGTSASTSMLEGPPEKISADTFAAFIDVPVRFDRMPLIEPTASLEHPHTQQALWWGSYDAFASAGSNQTNSANAAASFRLFRLRLAAGMHVSPTSPPHNLNKVL